MLSGCSDSHVKLDILLTREIDVASDQKPALHLRVSQAVWRERNKVLRNRNEQKKHWTENGHF